MLGLTRQIALRNGLMSDIAFQDRLAELEIELTALSAFFRHGVALHAAKCAPASLAPTVRVAGADLIQRSAELSMEAAGPGGAFDAASP